jgi:hypothetical protein
LTAVPTTFECSSSARSIWSVTSKSSTALTFSKTADIIVISSPVEQRWKTAAIIQCRIVLASVIVKRKISSHATTSVIGISGTGVCAVHIKNVQLCIWWWIVSTETLRLVLGSCKRVACCVAEPLAVIVCKISASIRIEWQ